MVKSFHCMKATPLAPCLLTVCLMVFGAACKSNYPSPGVTATASPPSSSKPLAPNASLELKQFIESVVAQTKVTTGYDPSYTAIDYPGGDVPPETGVCSDVIVRGFRKAGIDLQKEIHDDMGLAWSAYPRKWGAAGRDTNIDHRRVLNLTTYFERKNKALPVTANRDDYQPGDIVAWKLSEGVEHIGVVVNEWSEQSKGYLIVHNVGSGARLEDVLFSWEIIGHYRYF